ncbi:MAG: Enterochelin esterase-related enzyme [Actinomycetia bacterium]|jgi:S-formylglutathione hydrolase FrmB|nr:Enterochelin esterase-related enzyme [Actinomycetes bacterium]
MRRSSWRAAIALAALAFAAAAAASLSHQSRDLDERITSVALNGDVHARVILPASYDDLPHRRFPVIYFLHGLPADASAYRGNTWLANAMANVGPAILVLPQGSRAGDTDPEYLNWGSGRNWENYIARELPSYIDAHFRTIRSRTGRAIVGLSAGGYGATIVGLHHSGTFSVIESWSGYFHPTDPTGTQPLHRGPAANAHNLFSGLKGTSTFFAFYVGRSDSRFLAENEQASRELVAARVPHVFEVYAGAHETALWQAHAVAWLRLALRHLET